MLQSLDRIMMVIPVILAAVLQLATPSEKYLLVRLDERKPLNKMLKQQGFEF